MPVPVRPPPVLHGSNYDLYRQRICHPVAGAVFVMLPASCIVYGYHIHVEENALIAKSGEDYSVYMEETKIPVPGAV
jgi:protein-S-isoprenylcysteine O-methyltransferase Ste14